MTRKLSYSNVSSGVTLLFEAFAMVLIERQMPVDRKSDLVRWSIHNNSVRSRWDTAKERS